MQAVLPNTTTTTIMFPMRIIRLVVLISVWVFSLIVLGIAAHLTARTTEFGFTLNSMSLGLATAIFTFLSVPVLILIDYLRTGAFTSKVAVELGWIGVLWVLWLATGGASVGGRNFLYPSGCGFLFDDLNKSTCDEISAVMGISFFVWILLFAYFVLLLVFSAIAASRGQRGVWFSTVKETDFLAPSNNENHFPSSEKPPQQQAYAPPQAQQQYHVATGTPESQQYPPTGYAAPHTPVSTTTHSPYPQV